MNQNPAIILKLFNQIYIRISKNQSNDFIPHLRQLIKRLSNGIFVF